MHGGAAHTLYRYKDFLDFPFITSIVCFFYVKHVHARIQRGVGWQGIQTPDPLNNHESIGFLSNTCPDLLKSHKATKPTFNVGSSSAHQRNAILMMARFLWHLDHLSSHQLKKRKKRQSWTGYDKIFWIPA